MEVANLISVISLFVALTAFIISILDWLQIGREEPWEIQWSSGGYFVLKRLGYWPVVVQNIHNFHGGMVTVHNDSGFIPGVMGRNSRQLVEVDPVIPGTFIFVLYRRVGLFEFLKNFLGEFSLKCIEDSKSKFSRKTRNFIYKNLIFHNLEWERARLAGGKLWSVPVRP